MAIDTDFERTVYSSGVAPRLDLFTTFAEKVQMRVDEVLRNENCKWPLSYQEAVLLRLLKPHQGTERAIALGDLCERMKVTPRVVKDLVQNLRTNFVGQICASRDGEAGGYFLAATYDEVKSAAAPMRRQAIAMLRVVRAMEGPQHNIEEMLGQLRLELEAQ